jgi:hypothetical protein
MSFALQDIKEYWCMVCINEYKDHYLLVRESQDLKDYPEYECVSYDLEYLEVIQWPDYRIQEPGLYKLVLEPFFDEFEPEENKVFDCFKVVSFECLYEV